MNNTDVEKVLIEDYNVPKEELGKSLAAFYARSSSATTATQTIPHDLRERVPSDMWKKYVCAPVERRPGVLVIAVDDPQDLTRLDGIRAMNLSPRYDFQVGLRHEILAYIAASYGEKPRSRRPTAPTSPRSSTSSAKARADGRGRRAGRGAGDRRDRLRHRQARQPAHHRGLQPRRLGHPRRAGRLEEPCLIRLRIDGDCQKFMEVPAAHRNALVQRLKIMAKLDISERRKPQDGKIRFKYSKGTIELRVATIPTANRTRTWSCASSRRRSRCRSTRWDSASAT